MEEVAMVIYCHSGILSSGCGWHGVLASFPGPAQLFITCSTEKWGEPGIFSHVRMT